MILLCNTVFSSSGFSSAGLPLLFRFANISSNSAASSSVGLIIRFSSTYPPQGPKNPSISAGSSFLWRFLLSEALNVVLSNTVLPPDSSAASFAPIIVLPSSALPSTVGSNAYPIKHNIYKTIYHYSFF